MRCFARTAPAFLLLVLVSCISGPQHVRTDDAWIADLRGLAVEIIESEKDFFTDGKYYDELLRAVKDGKPRIMPSAYEVNKDIVCQAWRIETEPGKDGVPCYAEIRFEINEFSPEGKLGIGLVEMEMTEALPDGMVRIAMRSIRPRVILNCSSVIKPGEVKDFLPDRESFSRERGLTPLFQEEEKDLH